MIDFDLAPAEFHAEVSEQKPHLFRGALKERPIAWSDVDEMLHVIDPGLPIMRMFHNGPVPDNAYTEEDSGIGRARRKLSKARFYELLGGGATLQINWLEQHMVAAKRLCLEVARYAGTQTSCNAYMSFLGGGSFGQHWDTHDVFVIQLIGRKQWRVYEPTFPLPLTYQTHDRSGQTCPAEPALELLLEEGDVMYLPRGWWHHVIPLDVGSFHIAVGSYAPSTFDYLVQTTAKHLEQQLFARRAFSATGYRDAVNELVRQLPDVLLDPANVARFEQESAGRERMISELNLASLDSASSPLSGTSLVSLTTYRSLSPEDGTLIVNGQQVRLEPLSQAIVAALGKVASAPFDELCARLGNLPRDAVQRAVIELAHFDIVTVQR
ncbi:MAG TPA: cupin domain-containing protein [Gammaproteobacteria bacterium]|jgi:ribosomal protein L16 Arg81 hydroxylase